MANTCKPLHKHQRQYLGTLMRKNKVASNIHFPVHLPCMRNNLLHWGRSSNYQYQLINWNWSYKTYWQGQHGLQERSSISYSDVLYLLTFTTTTEIFHPKNKTFFQQQLSFSHVDKSFNLIKPGRWGLTKVFFLLITETFFNKLK